MKVMDPEPKIPLPIYRCHKEVEALKIKAVLNPNEGLSLDDGERILVFFDEGYQQCAFLMTAEYMRRHKPEAGGYWVRYRDGYESFSPAAAFEEGYTRCRPGQAERETV